MATSSCPNPRLPNLSKAAVVPLLRPCEPLRSHDESARRRSHVVKRIASNQRQCISSCRVEDLNIGGRHNVGRDNAILVLATVRRDVNRVILPEKSKRPKKSIPMTGNSDIAGFSRQRCTRNVARRQTQFLLSCTFDYDRC